MLIRPIYSHTHTHMHSHTHAGVLRTSYTNTRTRKAMTYQPGHQPTSPPHPTTITALSDCLFAYVHTPNTIHLNAHTPIHIHTCRNVSNKLYEQKDEEGNPGYQPTSPPHPTTITALTDCLFAYVHPKHHTPKCSDAQYTPIRTHTRMQKCFEHFTRTQIRGRQ